MKKVLLLTLAILVICTSFVMAKTKITYWQYFYQTKKESIDVLIKEFEKQNPDIDVEHVTFPYENYNQKIATSIPAGIGPDVLTLYYGWLPKYVDSGYLQPLPATDFTKEYIDSNFYSFVGEAMNYGGEYYALPTAVRSLALFWNKKLFKEVGLDPEKAPTTIEELLEYAKKLSKYDKKGNLIQAGLTTQTTGQTHHWIREVLVRQFGGAPYSSDNKEVTYDSPEGIAAFEWFMRLITEHKVGFPGFVQDDVTAFKAQKAAMTIDGSFRLGTLNKLPNLDYGVAVLPESDGIKSNFASFWTHGITTNAEGEKLEAAVKFLKFITSPEAQDLWLEKVGELPANPVSAQKYFDDPKYGPFLKGLDSAHTTFFVDEVGQRDVIVNAVDKVWLKDIAPATALEEAASEEQVILDNFWNK